MNVMEQNIAICFAVAALTLICSTSAKVKDINVVRMSQEFESRIFNQEYSETSNSNNVNFAFAKYFQDHMVLQQAPKQANIYGYSPEIGKKLIAMVTTDSKKYYYETVVKPGPAPGVGKWHFTLDPIKISTPASILVSSDNGTISLDDVLFGDVWLCSGQSNMQFAVSQALNGSKEIADAKNYPHIRLLTVTHNTSDKPLYDLISLDENWSLPNKSTVGGKAWSYFSAVCWMYGRRIHEAQGYPIGLIATNWGGTPVEAWSSPDALAKCNLGKVKTSSPRQGSEKTVETNDKHQMAAFGPEYERKLFGPHENSVLWNAMINPFLGLTFYGAIWYQGEADAVVGLVDHYNCTFPAMIEDWRLKFNKASQGQTLADFPFGFVQLAPNEPTGTGSLGFPDIRWHQTADIGYVPNAKMPNVFMAVAIDLPDPLSPFGPVHIRDKEDVAHRLALSGLAVAYKHDETFQGPFPVNATVTSDNEILIDYGSRWKLEVKGVDGFEVLCVPSAGGGQSMWIPTPIFTNSTTTVNIYLGVCGSTVQAVRYAWRISPCSFKACAVYSSVNSLPAPPFVAFSNKDNNGSLRFHFS